MPGENNQKTSDHNEKVSEPIQPSEKDMIQKEEANFENESDAETVKDTTENVPTEKSSVEMVFGIDLLHTMILEEMDDYDLLNNARLVNFSWNVVATKILEDRYEGIISFEYEGKESGFLCPEMILKDEENDSNRESEKNRSLPFLTALMSNSLTDYFPVTSFNFKYGSLEDLEFQEFFNLHGSHVRQLSLSIDHDDSNEGSSCLDSLRRLLTEQVPNLDTLYMEDFPEPRGEMLFPVTKNESMVPQNYLPNLSLVDIQLSVFPTDCLIELLQASPNVTMLTLSELNLPVVEYLIESEKLSLLLDSFSFNCKPENIEAYEKFAGTEAELMTIEVNLKATYNYVECPAWARFARCLEKILVKSSESLVRVTWFTSGHLPFFTIPTLKNVKEILFTDTTCNLDDFFTRHIKLPKTASLFPPGTASLSSVFPNVVSVTFDYISDFEESLMRNKEIYLEPLLTVKSLEMSRTDNFSPEVLATFAMMFPNVTHAKFEGIDNFPLVAQSLWKFSGLRKMELEINAFAYHNQYPALDLALTGLNSASAGVPVLPDELWDDRTERNLDENLVKKNPSIADLKDLAVLKIELVDNRVNLMRASTFLMTELSVSDAFSLLPNLVVLIDIKTEGKRSNFDQIKKSLSKMEQCCHRQIICKWKDQ